MSRVGFDPATATDIQAESWMMSLAPRAWRPYMRLMRLDRPIGTWLLLLPCWWSTALASHHQGVPVDPWLIALFGAGAIVMRGAGCVVNDLWDRDFDAKVARTATRPIPSGEVSLRQAFIFLGSLAFVGLLILLQLNGTAIALGVLSLALIVVYPLMKRITYWPQAFLGLTFNWGALMGWAAVTDDIGWPAAVMYVAGFFWTLGYDTIYGHQDKEDDILIGVKSSSIKLGRRTRPFVYFFYAVATAVLALTGLLAGSGWFFFAMLALAALQLVWQAATLDIDDPKNCLTRFKSNRDMGLILFLGCLLA